MCVCVRACVCVCVCVCVCEDLWCAKCFLVCCWYLVCSSDVFWGIFWGVVVWFGGFFMLVFISMFCCFLFFFVFVRVWVFCGGFSFDIPKVRSKNIHKLPFDAEGVDICAVCVSQ